MTEVGNPLPVSSTLTRKRKGIIAAFLIAIIAVSAVTLAYLATGGFNLQGANPSPTSTPTPLSSLDATSTLTSPFASSAPSALNPTSVPTPSPTAIHTPIQTPGLTDHDVITYPPITTSAPTPTPASLRWNKTYGGTGDDVGHSVVQTSDGGFVAAGYTDSFGAGSVDVYLFRTDSTGNMLWNKTYGGTSNEIGNSLVKASDGGYAIVGYTYSFGAGRGDVYLVKTDSIGNMLWNKTYGGTNAEIGESLVQTADGGYAITGYTSSFGAGGSDVYLVKTDSVGNMLWNKTYGGVDEDSGHSVIQTSGEGYVLVGYANSSVTNNLEFYLVRTDSVGNMVWNKTYGVTGHAIAGSVVQTSDGGYALVGYIIPPSLDKFFVYFVKTDSTGKMLWNKTYGGTSTAVGASVIQTGDGGYVIVGTTTSFGAGAGDAYLIKTDSIGIAQ
jgi:hypothetical protein